MYAEPTNITLYIALSSAISGLAGIFIKSGFDWLKKKSESNVELAKLEIDKDIDDIEAVRKDLEEAYAEIKVISSQLQKSQKVVRAQNKKIEQYDTMLKHLQFVLTLLSRQLMRRLQDDPESVALLNEVDDYIKTLEVKNDKTI